LSNYMLFFFSPLLNIFISLLVWFIFPLKDLIINFNFSLLFIFRCLSLTIYFIILISWSSNSKYRILGGLRRIAQVISYEVRFILIILVIIFFVIRFNFINLRIYQKYIWFILIFFPLFICLFISFLAETNRSPFDFVEGERELVSGFNIEYRGGLFAIIFLAEYIRILFFCGFLTYLYLGGVRFFIFYFKIIILVFIVIWIRGVIPRYRYDKLIYLCWKIYLPLSLNYLILILRLLIYFWWI
jgi:NADH-ubiquinone oxidoreductase chain 1